MRNLSLPAANKRFGHHHRVAVEARNYTPTLGFDAIIPGFYSCCSLIAIFYFRQVITKLIPTPTAFSREVFITDGDGEPFVAAG
jgi:hypothetical protein